MSRLRERQFNRLPSRQRRAGSAVGLAAGPALGLGLLLALLMPRYLASPWQDGLTIILGLGLLYGGYALLRRLPAGAEIIYGVSFCLVALILVAFLLERRYVLGILWGLAVLALVRQTMRYTAWRDQRDLQESLQAFERRLGERDHRASQR